MNKLSVDVQKAINVLNEKPMGKITVAAKIYGVGVSTLRMQLLRVQQRNTRGGNYRVLSDVFIT